MAAPKIVDFEYLEVSSGLSSITPGTGFVQVRILGGGKDNPVVMIGSIDTDTATAVGLHFLEAAQAAIGDAAVYRMVTEKLDLPPETAGALVADLRNYRTDMNPEEGPDGD